MARFSSQPQPHVVKFGCHDTRRNLPASTALKRGESNFLARFENVYLSQVVRTGRKAHKLASGREFALDGFGRADILFMAWKFSPTDEDFSAIALRNLRLTAIEAKLKDWRKGLMQASRYRFFANRALLVLPPATALIATNFIDTFKALNVGLWEFDEATGLLRKLFTPRIGRPLNSKARERAIHLISLRLKLS